MINHTLLTRDIIQNVKASVYHVLECNATLIASGVYGAAYHFMLFMHVLCTSCNLASYTIL